MPRQIFIGSGSSSAISALKSRSRTTQVQVNVPYSWYVRSHVNGKKIAKGEGKLFETWLAFGEKAHAEAEYNELKIVADVLAGQHKTTLTVEARFRGMKVISTDISVDY